MTNEIRKSIEFVKKSSVHEIANCLMMNINDRAETICDIVARMSGESLGIKIAKKINAENISRKQSYCIAYAIIENLAEYENSAINYEIECQNA